MSATSSDRPHRSSARVRVPTVAYAVATAGTLAFLLWRRDDHRIATEHAWGHAVVVAVLAVVLLRVERRAERGRRRDQLRLRVVSVVVPVSSVALALVPGFLPVWMRVEQAAYAVLLLPVALLTNAAPVRAAVRGSR